MKKDQSLESRMTTSDENDLRQILDLEARKKKEKCQILSEDKFFSFRRLREFRVSVIKCQATFLTLTDKKFPISELGPILAKPKHK